MTTKSGLPEQLRPYFWGYTFSRLSITKDKDLVIRRILTSGSWDAVRWLRKRPGDQALREWLLVHHGRGLTARPTAEPKRWLSSTCWLLADLLNHPLFLGLLAINHYIVDAFVRSQKSDHDLPSEDSGAANNSR